jgi:Cu(I)/Ag(I) efflux system membrane fusion protein
MKMRKIVTNLIFTLFLISNNSYAEGANYTCPMHPHYIAVEAGSCPICGMDLVPLEEDVDQSNKSNKSNQINKKGIVTISPETIQNIGVRTEKVAAAKFGNNVRSYGLVTENVRIQHDISSRIDGWIEELRVTAIGDEVKKGELLFSLYSPDLISAQQDYIAAIFSGSKSRITSTAKRLKSLGVQDEALKVIKRKRQKLQNIPFYSEVDGIVNKLNIRKGTYVKSGMQLAVIQDYSSVWINVSVAEKDLGFLNKDMKAEVTFPNVSNETRLARIDYIYPTINEASRTGRVRLILNNQDGKLRPGSYADVNFETTSVKRLSIPSESILKSSEGDHVVVDLGSGRFESRIVKTGVSNKGRIQIISGLKEGETVVVSSQFLIDSESSLRESFRKMQKMQTPLSLLEVNNDQMAMINHLVDGAIYLHESIINDQEVNDKMLMPALKLNDHLMPKFRGTKLQFILEGAEQSILQAQNSITKKELREALANLIRNLKPWLLEGKPQYYKDKGLKLFMDHNSGNLWIQLDEKGVNPYGDGHIMPQEWPNPEEVKMPEMDKNKKPGGAHAGH